MWLCFDLQTIRQETKDEKIYARSSQMSEMNTVERNDIDDAMDLETWSDRLKLIKLMQRLQPDVYRTFEDIGFADLSELDSDHNRDVQQQLEQEYELQDEEAEEQVDDWRLEKIVLHYDPHLQDQGRCDCQRCAIGSESDVQNEYGHFRPSWSQWTRKRAWKCFGRTRHPLTCSRGSSNRHPRIEASSQIHCSCGRALMDRKRC